MTQTKTKMLTLAALTQGKGAASSPTPATPAAAVTAPEAKPTPPLAWSEDDETTFRALQQRRKQAGHKGRGADVAAQTLALGTITPNANTVAAVIVGLVPAKGTISRGELIARMAAADYTSEKAKPQDRHWCQGYVAGVIRSGFINVMSETSGKTAPAAEAA